MYTDTNNEYLNWNKIDNKHQLITDKAGQLPGFFCYHRKNHTFYVWSESLL